MVRRDPACSWGPSRVNGLGSAAQMVALTVEQGLNSPMRNATELSLWHVLLCDGSRVEIWADSVDGLTDPNEKDDYVFGMLVDASPEEQASMEVVSRTPSNHERVVVAVARFPRGSVTSVTSA